MPFAEGLAPLLLVVLLAFVVFVAVLWTESRSPVVLPPCPAHCAPRAGARPSP